MKLIKMGIRNIFRSKKRTLITLSAISIGLALLIIGLSLMNGIDKQSINNIIRSQTSHIKIFKKGYKEKRDEFPMNLTISENSPIFSFLEKLKTVLAVEKRVIFAGSLIKDNDELPCIGVGIDVLKDPKVFNIKESIISGGWLQEGKEQVLIGENFAQDMGLSVGDYVTVRMVTSKEGEQFSWNAADLEIRGIFDTKNPAVDSGYIFIPLHFAQESLSLNSEITEIVVRLRSDSKAILNESLDKIDEINRIKNLELEVCSWKELAGDFLAISKIKSKSTSIIVLIMLFIASMGIVNTMLMAVLERTREIGMLKALGMNRLDIVKLFLIEGGFIGVLGSLLSCLIGGLGSWYLEVYGWSIESMGKIAKQISQAAYPVKDVFYSDLTASVLILTFLLGTAISIIASLYPAIKASKMNAVDALRYF